MSIEVKELRSGQRYVPDTPLPASFGSAEVHIVNISSGGVQILHPLPQRVGSASRLFFRLGDVVVSTTGRMIWSHLSKSPGGGKMTYQSGLRVEDPEFAAAVQALVTRGIVSPDGDSMERKRKRLIEKEKEKSDKHLVKALPSETTLPSEQMLLIQQVRERLRANPAEASRLYEQARTADAATGVPQDVLAVWEYLERTISLAMITRVFERNR
ncbi:MAG TPA: hypothetical protein VKB93_16905 [Thermoanaerobaculia bacterium]|nr:hypothetical protein [Thermoanaerobaculia bacterium]